MAIVFALPSTLISARLGIFVFESLTDRQFRQALIWLMLGSGVAILLRELSAFSYFEIRLFWK